jgi:serine/threonine protein kinase
MRFDEKGRGKGAGRGHMGSLIINGRYEVTAELGRGGMGIVYRAVQKSLDRVVAIKMLSRELAGDQEFRQRFQQEAQAIARLQHENIITVHDIEQDRGTFFIIMEHVEGVAMQELLRREGAMAPERACALAAQVARALGYAHDKGIIHRDIKPDNIMVVDQNKAMVMDFGIARVADSTLKTQTGVSMGTPKYMSPEQARGQRVDRRSDLYSLGVVLYACVTGVLPFDGDSPFTVALKHMQDTPPPPSTKVENLPPAVEHVILRSMAKDPVERYQSGEEFALALEKAIATPDGPSLTAEDEILEAVLGKDAAIDSAASMPAVGPELSPSPGAVPLPSFETPVVPGAPPEKPGLSGMARAAIVLIPVVAVGAVLFALFRGEFTPEPVPPIPPTPTVAPTATAMQSIPSTTPVAIPTASAPTSGKGSRQGPGRGPGGGRPGLRWGRIAPDLLDDSRPAFGGLDRSPGIKKACELIDESVLFVRNALLAPEGPFPSGKIDRLAELIGQVFTEAEKDYETLDREDPLWTFLATEFGRLDRVLGNAPEGTREAVYDRVKESNPRCVEFFDTQIEQIRRTMSSRFEDAATRRDQSGQMGLGQKLPDRRGAGKRQ